MLAELAAVAEGSGNAEDGERAGDGLSKCPGGDESSSKTTKCACITYRIWAEIERAVGSVVGMSPKLSSGIACFTWADFIYEKGSYIWSLILIKGIVVKKTKGITDKKSGFSGDRAVSAKPGGLFQKRLIIRKTASCGENSVNLAVEVNVQRTGRCGSEHCSGEDCRYQEARKNW